MTSEFPRRARLDRLTPEELAIFNMIGEIEKLGAHPLLTDVVVLLGQARDKLADWVELPGSVTAACGHDTTNEWFADTVVVVKGWTRDHHREARTRTACKTCREGYERVGLILHDPGEERAWLSGEMEYTCAPA